MWTNSLRAVIAAVAECFPYNLKWPWNEQVCQGVTFKADRIPRYTRTYLFLFCLPSLKEDDGSKTRESLSLVLKDAVRE